MGEAAATVLLFHVSSDGTWGREFLVAGRAGELTEMSILEVEGDASLAIRGVTMVMLVSYETARGGTWTHVQAAYGQMYLP